VRPRLLFQQPPQPLLRGLVARNAGWPRGAASNKVFTGGAGQGRVCGSLKLVVCILQVGRKEWEDWQGLRGQAGSSGASEWHLASRGATQLASTVQLQAWVTPVANPRSEAAAENNSCCWRTLMGMPMLPQPALSILVLTVPE